MEWYWYIVGVELGMLLMWVIQKVNKPEVGTLVIDTSDDEKDVFRFEFAKPPEDVDKEYVTLRVVRK